MSETKYNEFESLRNRLSEFRADPPEEVWDYVSRNIPGRGRKRNMILLFATAATIALALSLGFSLRYINKTLRPIQELALSDTASGEKTVATPQNIVAQRDAATEEESVVAPQHFVAPRDAASKEESVAAPQHIVAPLETASKEEAVAAPQHFVAPLETASKEEAVAAPQHIVALLETASKEEAVAAPQHFVAPLETAPKEESVAAPQHFVAPLETASKEETAFEEELQRSEKSRWIISGIISPLYSYRDAGGNMDAANAASNMESGMIAYAGGVNVGFEPSDRFTIESGLMFNKMGINIGEVAGLAGSWRAFDFSPLSNDKMSANIIPVTNSIGNIVSNSGDIFINNYKGEELYTLDIIDNVPGIDQAATLDGVRQNLEYLEVPLNMRYSIIDRSVELQLIGGMSTNFLVKNNVTAETANGTEEIGYISNINSINFSGNAGIGMIYHFHTNFSISLEPRFRYYLNSINDNSLPVTRPYSIGIYTGINYRF